MHIKVGTRGSKLALIQTHSVVDVLEKAYPFHQFEIVVIHTQGDSNLKPLSQIGGNGLFINEIEQQLLDGTIQMAVHSMKDLPCQLKQGLVLSKTWKRADNHDVLILNHENFNEKGVVATGSIRRKKQIQQLYKDIEVVDIRGNVDTRLKKMKEQDLEGLILAKAGIERLNLDVNYKELPYQQMIPSCCQGALAIELREDNIELLEMVNVFCDETSDLEIQTERAFLKEMNSSCQNPIGGYAKVEKGQITFHGLFGLDHLYTACCTGKDPEQVARQVAKDIRKQMSGMVYITGAGPGNIGNVTLKALEVVKKADCILYDRLTPQKLLQYTKEDCECIYVGKASHNHTLKQDQINELMVQKALQYKIVVRLKGGDPFVFGRGYEEVQYLISKGIPYEIISGLSSSIAGPGSLQIPLTHRNVSNGFHVITAHNSKGEYMDIDFESLSKSKETLVFLMGLKKVKEIAKNLIQHGMDENMPIGILSNVCMESNQNQFSTLKDIQNESISVSSPAIIIVGKCVSYHQENSKLYSEKTELVLPKIGKQKSRLAALLDSYIVHEIMVSQIEMIPYKIKEIPDIILFTSQYGIDGFFKYIEDIRKYSHTKFAVVGKKSAQHLKSYGIQADFIPSIYNADTLLNELIINSDQTVYYFSSDKKDEIDQLIDKCNYHKVSVYRNDPCLIPSMNVKYPVIFTCANNVSLFLNSISNLEEFKEKGVAYSIGKKTTERLKEFGVKHIYEAKQASYESLKELICHHEN